MYLFFLAVAAIQGIEFFLWNHLDNKTWNINLSYLCCFIIGIQPLFLILMIPTLWIRYVMLFLHAVYLIVFYIKRKHYYTSVGKNGHLRWEWLDYKGYEYIWFFVYLLFYIIPVLLLKNNTLTFMLLTLLGLSLFFYFKHHTFGTIWCWVSNFYLLFFLIDILLIQPYLNHSIC